MAANVDTIIISPSGDLILEVSQEEGGAQYAYRVDSNVLRQNSRYFENLLSDRFSEGQKLSAALSALKIAGSNIADASADDLPRISLVNIGRISKVSSIENLTADFLRVLHGQDLPAQPPVANLANIAVVADRFDAVPHIARFIQRKKYLQAVEAKTKGKSSTNLTEERVRQRLLIGVLLDHPPWVARYSKHLILRDSIQWKPAAELDDTAALWWDIPNGVEGGVTPIRSSAVTVLTSCR